MKIQYNHMKQYLDLSKKILSEGEYEWNERTKTGTLALFGETCQYDLKEGFPLTTTKKLGWRLPIEEMLYFFRGDSDLKTLTEKNINIWNANGFGFYLRRNDLTEQFPKHSQEWREKFSWYIDQVKNNPDFSKEERTLGRIYGVQARDWKGPKGETIDQLGKFLEKLKKDPSSRSNIVSHFNPAEMGKMSLGPCHLLYQSRVVEDDNRLDVLMYQRSCDNLLGVPFNIAQYAFLIEMAAKETGLSPGKFAHQLGNFHYYLGPAPRSEFLRNKDNLKEFQGMVKEAKGDDFKEIFNWYLENAPRELEGTEGTDQIPFALLQMACDPKPLPNLEFKISNEDFDFWKAIKMDAKDLVEIKNYQFHDPLIYSIGNKIIKPVMAA